MNCLAQQPLPPEIINKEINRLLEEALKTLKSKTWLERIYEIFY